MHPDLPPRFSGRVVIKQGQKLWYLLQLNDDGRFVWLEVAETLLRGRKSYIAAVPHNSKTTDALLDGVIVEYPGSSSRS